VDVKGALGVCMQGTLREVAWSIERWEEVLGGASRFLFKKSLRGLGKKEVKNCQSVCKT